ncbi:DDE-type integrase/transposase/recombinase, partial [Klebsiella pneumoniae]
VRWADSHAAAAPGKVGRFPYRHVCSLCYPWEGQPPVNAKRLYRIMSEHNLLLLHHKPERPKREHKGKIAVAESDMRWCSDGFEFGCDNGEKLRVTFALDCCDREAIDWAASTGGYDSSTVQDVMLRSVEKRFGDRLPDTAVQ